MSICNNKEKSHKKIHNRSLEDRLTNKILFSDYKSDFPKFHNLIPLIDLLDENMITHQYKEVWVHFFNVANNWNNQKIIIS